MFACGSIYVYIVRTSWNTCELRSDARLSYVDMTLIRVISFSVLTSDVGIRGTIKDSDVRSLLSLVAVDLSLHKLSLYWLQSTSLRGEERENEDVLEHSC